MSERFSPSQNSAAQHDSQPISSDTDLVERFIAAYNTIDQHLQKELGEDTRASFRSLVDIYAKRHPWWSTAERLRVYANLRNIIVHEKTEPYTYICVPTPATVAGIETIRDDLIDPPRVIPSFQRQVTTVRTGDSLSAVLKLIHQHEYSRFPVYDRSRFVGLLTENGITRWLARHVAEDEIPINLNMRVGDVLPEDEKRSHVKFVPPDTPVEHVAYQFRENSRLIAVLITPDGRGSEKLLGIITRGDVLRPRT